jgi:hypothetical protein
MVAHSKSLVLYYYVCIPITISGTPSSGEPSKDCPDIADKLTLHLTFGTPTVCQDVSGVSVLLIVGVHVVVEEGPIISSAQWTLGRSPKRNRAGAPHLLEGNLARPEGKR